MGDTAKIIPSMFQVNTHSNAFMHQKIYANAVWTDMYMSKTLILNMQVHETILDNFIIIGGHVIHSYGRLVHHHHVITRGDQLLPPGDETAPGRMDCIITAPETARFIFTGPKPPTSIFSQSDDDGDQMTTVFFNRSHLSINTEGFCQGANTYFFLSLLPGNTYY